MKNSQSKFSNEKSKSHSMANPNTSKASSGCCCGSKLSDEVDEIDIIDTPALQEAFDEYISQNSPSVKSQEQYTAEQQKAILSLLYDVMMADKVANPLEKRFLNKYFCKFNMSIFEFEYIEKERSIAIAKNMSDEQKSDLKRILNAMAFSDYVFKEEEKKYIEEITSFL